MLGRYTTGPSAARREDSRCPDDCRDFDSLPTGAGRAVRAILPVPMIDLRSDTVTRPTPEMRRAMADAEVGDDVLGEDPTVNALEERAAELLGKEAGLFVSSGTMGNLVAQMAHLARGQEAIAGREAHLVIDEAANHAVVVGSSIRQLAERPDGTLDLDEVEEAFRNPDDYHEPPTRLVAMENTSSHSMGQPISSAYTSALAAVAHRHAVPLHVDGARFWNAAVALRITGRELAAAADTVTFCLSKGLGCPVGSMVVGPADVIARARRGRKLLGGGMRQAGILAAAGVVALRDGDAGMIERLAEDHANARRLADALSGLDGVASPGGIAQPAPGPLDPQRVRTNFVLFRVQRDRSEFLGALRARGVLMIDFAHGQVRAVTHNDVTAGDIETVISATREALAETAVRPLAEAIA
jgi:threonine aldolase